MLEERRRIRSEYKDIALQFFFRSVAETNQLIGLVLADSMGLLVASSLPRRVAEEIAAQAPYLAGASELFNAISGNEDYPLMVHEISVGGHPFYLCLVGRAKVKDQSLTSAEGGVRRILQLN
jgi:hypothetical protein